jgi:hypothetical protein
LHDAIETVQTLDPAVAVTARASAPVDRRNFDGVEHVVLFGASGDRLSPSLKAEAKLEASDDGTNWTAVTAARDVNGGQISACGVFATVDAAAKAQREYRVGYCGKARYSRVTLVLTGTHVAWIPVSALAVLARAHRTPAV